MGFWKLAHAQIKGPFRDVPAFRIAEYLIPSRLNVSGGPLRIPPKLFHEARHANDPALANNVPDPIHITRARVRAALTADDDPMNHWSSAAIQKIGATVNGSQERLKRNKTTDCRNPHEAQIARLPEFLVLSRDAD